METEGENTAGGIICAVLCTRVVHFIRAVRSSPLQGGLYRAFILFHFLQAFWGSVCIIDIRRIRQQFKTAQLWLFSSGLPDIGNLLTGDGLGVLTGDDLLSRCIFEVFQ